MSDQTPRPTADKSNVLTSGSASAKRKARRYGFACASCKSRKVKCSGDQPVCAGCRRSGDNCVWPSSSKPNEYQLLRNANERIRQLEASLDSRSPVSAGQSEDRPAPVRRARRSNGRIPNDAVRNSTSALPHQPSPSSTTHAPTRPRRANRRASSVVQGHSSGSGPSPSTVRSGEQASPTANTAKNTDPSLTTSLWYQVGIGEDGAVIYNGPTSRFHAGSLVDENEEADADADGGHENRGHAEEREEGLWEGEDMDPSGGDGPESDPEPHPGHIATLQSQYALMDSVWMPLISAKATMNGTGVDTFTGVILLDIYWTWLHPLHNIVYRPAFLMDLALGGPNCSDFLLLCIFGLAARHLPSEEYQHSPDSLSRGEQYVTQAKRLLLDEMATSTPTIPTIQGLLILGGRQCAMGQSSQGWLYTGMAIRMMQDIGLHLDTTHLVGLMERWTPAETETRKRLYNSAYLWDKTLSLALGRPPSLVRPPYSDGDIHDKFDDERLWRPIHATEVAGSFVSSPSWVTSTLCASCSLHEITTDMMLLFSRSSGAGNFTEQVQDLDARFRQWYEETPAHLKVEEPSLLNHSPPPHIVSLNLLYHTLHILLRRPFLGAGSQSLRDEHINLCITHSKKIHSIHTLYAKTFPHRLMTYQVSYCIYTAATVEALELKRTDAPPREREEAAARLAAAVKILQNEASHTPGSGKSLDTIRRLLSEGQRQKQRTQRQRLRQRQRPRGQRQQRFTNTRRYSNDNFMRDTNGGDMDIEDRNGEGQQSITGVPGQSTSTGEHRQAQPHAQNIGQTSGFPAGSVVTDGGFVMAEPNMSETHPNYDASPYEQYDPGDYAGLGGNAGAFGHFWGGDIGYYGGTDTGAGFHPDAFSWGIPDDLARMPTRPQGQATPAVPPTSNLPLGTEGWSLSNA